MKINRKYIFCSEIEIKLLSTLKMIEVRSSSKENIAYFIAPHSFEYKVIKEQKTPTQKNGKSDIPKTIVLQSKNSNNISDNIILK